MDEPAACGRCLCITKYSIVQLRLALAIQLSTKTRIMPKPDDGAPRNNQPFGDVPAVRSAKAIRVLLLEDSEADAELIRHELDRGGLVTLIERVDSEEAFASAVRDFAPDV